MPFRIWDTPGCPSSLQLLPTPQPTLVGGEQTPKYPQSPQGSGAPFCKLHGPASASCPYLPALRHSVATAACLKAHSLKRGVLWTPLNVG